MGVKQTVIAECDAIDCFYEKNHKDRSIQEGDSTMLYEDIIMHGKCFDAMSAEAVVINLRLRVKQGHFHPTAVVHDSDGLPDLSTFISNIPVSA